MKKGMSLLIKILLCVTSILLGLVILMVCSIEVFPIRPLLFYLLCLPICITFILTPLWIKLSKIPTITIEEEIYNNKKIRQYKEQKARSKPQKPITRFIMLLPRLIIGIVLFTLGFILIFKKGIYVFAIIIGLIIIFDTLNDHIQYKKMLDERIVFTDNLQLIKRIEKAVILDSNIGIMRRTNNEYKFVEYVLKLYYTDGSTKVIEIRTDEVGFNKYEQYLPFFDIPDNKVYPRYNRLP